MSLVGQLERDPLHHRTIVCVAVRRRFRANLAARLCAEARSGQILIDPKVHSTIETQAELEPAGELVLKGIHRPVATFNVLAMRESQA